MELTREEVEKMFAARLEQYPEIKEIVTAPTFKEEIARIAAFEGIGEEYLPILENEVMVILTFYAPLRELGSNVAESTGLPLEKGENFATMVDSILLGDIHDELLAFELHWDEQLETAEATESSVPKEPLELRPENRDASAAVIPEAAPALPKALTREELMNALSAKRTMASDIEAVRHKEEVGQGNNTPAQGYAAHNEERERRAEAEKKEE